MRKQTVYVALAVVVSYAAMMSLAIAVNLTPVFLTTLSYDLGGASGLTKEQLGRIPAVIFAGLVVGILVAGPLADRLGAKPFAVLGNLLISAGLAMLGTAGSYAAVLAASFVMGTGAGILDMVLSPIVCALQPHRRTSAMNWLHSFYCTGAVATVLIGSLALTHGIAWRAISLWMTLMPAVVALGFAIVPLPPLVAHGKERTRLRDLIRIPAFLVTLAAIFLGGATELGMAQWLPYYAENALKFSEWTGGMALLAFSVAMAVGRIAVGMMGPRLNAVRLMFHLCWMSGVLFLAGSFAPIAPVALGACILVGLTGSCLWPSILGVAADEFPQGGASMFAMLAAMGNFGGVFVPWVVGVTADHSSMHWGLSTGAVCPLLLAAILVWMSRRRRRTADFPTIKEKTR